MIAEPKEIILAAVGVKKHFPIFGGIFLRQIKTVYAVDDISFQVLSGETLGLVGESGCGKTTVGRTILRLYDVTAGQIWFQGTDITQLSTRQMRRKRRQMQMIFQDPFESLNARHTVGTILEEPFLIHQIGTPKERRQEIDRLLERVGLPSVAFYRYPHEFSGGQRQRIGIARAISLRPKFIVCDEPVSALDVSIQSQILNLLLELQEEMGLTYLFIAHDLAVVKHMSMRIAVMYLGKVVEFTDSERIYLAPLHPYTYALLSSIPIPDPSVKRKRVFLQGEVPSPIHPPSGCYFHTRCPYAQDICQTQEPPLQSHENDEARLVACHFAGKLPFHVESLPSAN